VRTLYKGIKKGKKKSFDEKTYHSLKDFSSIKVIEIVIKRGGGWSDC
jgi:hypothetical protein